MKSSRTPDLDQDEGVSIALEQNTDLALECADHGHILGSGRIMLNGREGFGSTRFHLGTALDGRKGFRDCKS